jgi:DNA-3-methyladenine glycosylase II
VIIATPDIPLNFVMTLDRYLRFGPDAANRFDGTTFQKVIHTPAGLRLMSLSSHDGTVTLSVEPDEHNPDIVSHIQSVAEKILGLSFSLPAFYAWSVNEPPVKQAVDAFTGLRPTLIPNPFEMLVTAISAQQINLSFAFTTRSRLVTSFGAPFTRNNDTFYAFPTPQTLANTDPDDLHRLQWSRRKATCVIEMAKAIESGTLDIDALANADNETVITRLTTIKGIGRWTADQFLARCLGRGDAVAVGDLAVRNTLRRFYPDESADEPALRNLSRRFGACASLATLYLMRLYSAERDTT